MSKPKTGKAIMTDEEIHSEWVLTTMGTGTLKTDLMALIKFARAEGIAQGRAEMFEQGEKLNRTMATMLGERCAKQVKEAEKQAYAKGVADGKAEEKINLQKKSYQQLKFYDSGYEQGQSDIKARLILIIQKDHDLCESCYIDLEEALAEATKGGDGK